MGSLKKFDGSSWINSNLRKLTTDTDTFTTFPAIIYTEGTNATVGLKGNTVQSGTPTPDSPIMPQGTGERTGNLLNFNALKSAPSGRIPNSTYTFEHLLIISVEPNTAYTLSSTGTGDTGGAAADNRSLYINGTGDNEVVFANHPITKTTGADGLLYVGFESSRPNAAQYLNGTAVIMFNLGSTALPYEPYGYKIPISSANTTTPVYLGEVETTREVKKLVLTGEESYELQSINSYGIANFYFYLGTSVQTAICSHFKRQTTIIGQTTDEGHLISLPAQSGQIATFYMRISSSTASTVAELKAWLAAQYAAGTPVTIWYVLANEETAVVNEPLMKIDDYADTVSGISIPVTAGGDILSVGTTIQPSEVTANFYGWHTITVHERESGQRD